MISKILDYKNILITGGAGFVGSNLAIKLAEHYPGVNITALDNLKRRGSELNIQRLLKAGVKFLHGDIRNKEDLELDSKIDLIIECSAEPSVLAGIDSSPEYLINTNLVGTINCLELTRRNSADFIFLSTSRVYPIEYLNRLKFKEGKTRFELDEKQDIKGASGRGISEDFPLDRTRSLYGATKLASEILLQEYIESYKIRGVINRCGVITGPWQMGKVDQGVIVLWLARHMFKKPLSYIGYGGIGKQVRDFIHADDLFDLLNIQMRDMDRFNGSTYNIGGGVENSVSLLELTKYCQDISGNKVSISSVAEDRPNDVPIYISDCTKIKKSCGWTPKRGAQETIRDIYDWIGGNQNNLAGILG